MSPACKLCKDVFFFQPTNLSFRLIYVLHMFTFHTHTPPPSYIKLDFVLRIPPASTWKSINTLAKYLIKIIK